MGYTVSKALPEEYNAVSTLLSNQGLPSKDISRRLDHFFVIRENGNIIAVIGLEIYGKDALLRSMATNPDYRKKGLASSLVDYIIAYAKTLQLTSLFLLTETAEAFFDKRKFSKIERRDAPETIRTSSEFCHACPASAALMKKEIH